MYKIIRLLDKSRVILLEGGMKRRRSAPMTQVPAPPLETGLWSSYFYQTGYGFTSNNSGFMNFSPSASQDYSIAFWHKPSGLSGGNVFRYLFGRYDFSAFTYQFAIRYTRTTKNIIVSRGGGNSTINSAPVTEGVWEHHVISQSGGFLDYYKNGLRVGFATQASGAAYDGDVYTVIGHDRPGTFTNQMLGHLYETMVWSRALTPAESYSLCNLGTYDTNGLTGRYIETVVDDSITDSVSGDKWIQTTASGVARSLDLPTRTGIPMSLGITSPNMNSSWLTETANNIIWTYAGPIDVVDLDLYYNDVLDRSIVSGVVASGLQYSWTIPAGISTNAYSIKINTRSGMLTDTSEYFSIIQPAPEPEGFFQKLLYWFKADSISGLIEE